MNYNEEMAREMKNAGLKVKLVELPEELRATPEDFAELERAIAIRTHENEIMLAKSIQYSMNSIVI